MKTELVIVLAALLLGGCATPTERIPAPVDRRVTLASDLADDILVNDIRCVRGVGNCLTFQATVINRKASDCGIEWRVVWLDGSGIEIESAVSTWRKVMVAQQDVATLWGTASTPAAADMRFYVRRLRR